MDDDYYLCMSFILKRCHNLRLDTRRQIFSISHELTLFEPGMIVERLPLAIQLLSWINSWLCSLGEYQVHIFLILFSINLPGLRGTRFLHTWIVIRLSATGLLRKTVVILNHAYKSKILVRSKYLQIADSFCYQSPSLKVPSAVSDFPVSH